MTLVRSLPLLLALVACRAPSASPGGGDDSPDAGVAMPDGYAGPDFCGAREPRTTPIAVFPTPESGEAPYTDALASAHSSIDMSIYLMGYGGILDQLEAKASAGLAVRVILDKSEINTNQKYYDRLAAAGVQVKWSDPRFTYFHNKYFVVDGNVAVFSTGNWSKDYSINLERNFASVDRDPADVADLSALFAADWAGTAPAMQCTRMVISPINARERILDVITSAQHTLLIESMQFADTAVRDAVKARIAAGVEVRALLADPSWISANASAATFLQGLGVTVKHIPHLHTKMLVADGVTGYVGSENFSYTSLDKNREVGAILVEASSVAPLAMTFETDWTAGVSF